jgi:hypothetical protein
MAITINGTNGLTTDNGALKLDTDTLVVDDTNNRVGIGTSSPKTRLQSSAGGVLNAPSLGSSSTNAPLYLTNNDTSYGLVVGVSSADGHVWLQAQRTDETATAYNITLNEAGGNVLVATTVTPSATSTSGAGAMISSLAGIVQNYSGNGAANYVNKTDYVSGTTFMYSFRVNGATCGTISSANGTSTSYTTSSDYRLKEDWQPMSGSVDRVKALNPVNFAWKLDGSRVDGFLAHEAQAVVPEAVTGTKDAMRDEEYEVTAAIEATYDEEGNELTAAVPAVMGTRTAPDYQGIDQSKLVPLLTAALQDSIAKIEALEARVTALENA